MNENDTGNPTAERIDCDKCIVMAVYLGRANGGDAVEVYDPENLPESAIFLTPQEAAELHLYLATHGVPIEHPFMRSLIRELAQAVWADAYETIHGRRAAMSTRKPR